MNTISAIKKTKPNPVSETSPAGARKSLAPACPREKGPCPAPPGKFTSWLAVLGLRWMATGYEDDAGFHYGAQSLREKHDPAASS